MDKVVIEETKENYKTYLELSEYSKNSIKKYLTDINMFLKFLENQDYFDKYTIIKYKNYLLSKYKISSVNSYIISLNKYLSWINQNELKVKVEKIQRKMCLNRVINKDEYIKMLKYLKDNNKKRDYLLIKTFSMTGIRVGELKFITYESAKQGEAEITFKGKTRIVYIAERLSEQLIEYCIGEGISRGIIFYGKDTKKALDASGVWKRMKRIAKYSGVPEEVVYPHSFRHFFAKTFMEKVGNIVELADLLGHSNIEMTRIYTLSSSKEKQRMLNILDEMSI